MELNEFKDKVFDILNESDILPIQDMEVKDKQDVIIIRLSDGNQFIIKCENYGKWCLVEV